MKYGALFDSLLDENEVQKDCQRLTILLQGEKEEFLNPYEIQLHVKTKHKKG